MDDQKTDRAGSVNDRPNRRGLRFSLRTFFLLITVIAIWLGWNAQQLRNRAVVERFILANSGGTQVIEYGPPLKPWNGLPVTWRILGARSVSRISLKYLTVTMEGADYTYIRKYFPEAEINH
jgi:hypothetical protein